ncbi:MAG TPA: hypothetical protein DEA75_08060 [Rhodobacteraceae bacterium]|nr:hypothetical protein [Paracoccaceae bacterium]
MHIPQMVSCQSGDVANRFSAGNKLYDVVSLRQCLEAIATMTDCWAFGMIQLHAFFRSCGF